MFTKKQTLFLSILFYCISFAFSQEAIKSEEDFYFDFLTLNGSIDKPTYNFKTLSDLQYDTLNGALWSGNRLSTDFYTEGESFQFKLYSPEWYSSFNLAAPYGINDGGLWQGKGYNTSLTFGVRAEVLGFELTFKPQLSFSQNMEFDYPYPYSSYYASSFKNKAGVYGNYGFPYIDAPQRFGNESFANFDWGDTEVRYSFKTLTVGFGTEYIWLGPAYLNPLMHSNNAQGYPKIDFGIRKQRLEVNNLWLGTIEGRYWLGQLSESDYFNDITEDNKNLIAGISLAYEVPFLQGFIVSFNRTMLSKWNNINSYTMFSLLIPKMKKKMGYDESDQRASLAFEYFIPAGGMDLYFEWGKNDYNSGFDNLMRYPFHTQAITAGFKKNINYSSDSLLNSQLILEMTFIESSMDYHFFYDWGGSGNYFYTHHFIQQGYTNKGQYLGAGIGSGGNSQYIEYKLLYPKGYTSIFAQRANPDLNYFYFIAPRDSNSKTPNEDVKSAINVNLSFGIKTLYYFTDRTRLTFSLILEDEQNPLLINNNAYGSNGVKKSEHRCNFVTQFALKYFL